jgi:hypothetical protein
VDIAEAIPTPPRMTINSVCSHLFTEPHHEPLETVRIALECHECTCARLNRKNMLNLTLMRESYLNAVENTPSAWTMQ